MYLSYFDKFYDMEPYLFIDEEEWEYIKKTFDKQDVRESLAKVAMSYPPPYMDISEKDARRELQKLKGMRHNEILVDLSRTYYLSTLRMLVSSLFQGFLPH